MNGRFILLAAAGVVMLSASSQADVVSTAVGNGADVEMDERNDPTAARNSDDLNTRYNTTDRNELVGLRFDLTGYDLSTLDNVSLNLVNYRDNSTRYIAIYGVTQGASGGTGTYTTETWSDATVAAWGDLPGLEVTDGTDTTRSIDLANLTLLTPSDAVVGATEGTIDTVSSAELTSFVKSYSGSSMITFLITQGNDTTSGGQFRFASKEAAQTAGGVLTGSAGDFAPYLEFDVIPEPATIGLLGVAGVGIIVFRRRFSI